MIVQIYEVTSAAEAAALSAMGVDHVGVLVGDGAFPRELSIDAAREVVRAVTAPAKASVLALSHDLSFIRTIVEGLAPDLLHLGALPGLLAPAVVRALKQEFPRLPVMRSIPVTGEDSVALARSYDGAADLLLLDSYRASDRQFGALGETHDWALDRKIVEASHIPVIVAGGLGPENVAACIRATRPYGVDSKTRTDKQDGSHTKNLARVREFVRAARATCAE